MYDRALSGGILERALSIPERALDIERPVRGVLETRRGSKPEWTLGWNRKDH